ncbi:energy-coupling factor transporter transmembrane component T family protein [Brevibacterium marinum]|uniref:Energy-coupling factor transport system permease protein n=1 Tax=Brevibacterium marinum TaxID=418643 RepID=A0A846S4F4_9MICO|nr:energy-coupling factor transporter transmembrane component T [Brevibacterium marinum]NJC57868.1 energy-coupling factor transport system permease protein [Brevibacterium marinum]
MTTTVLDREQQSTRRWHPATEIIVLACSLLLVFGIPSPVVPIAIMIATFVSAAVAPTVRLRTWLIGVGVLCLPTLLVLSIVQGLFYPGTEVSVLWEFGPARLTVEGLAIAVQIWLRVSALVSLCALFGLGTDSARLFDGLRTLRLPSSVAYICASAIGLIPLIRARTGQILEARASRGWNVGSWLIRTRLLPSIVTGLFTSILIEVEQRHDVLAQRGLDESTRPSSLQDHRDGRGQRLLRRGAPVLTCVLIVCSVTGLLPLPTAEQVLGGA